MILLACAVAQELARWEGHDAIEPVITGIGPVAAACAVTAALARKRYQFVVNAGVGGSLDDAISIGTGVIVATDRFELSLEGGTPLQLADNIHIDERAHSDGALVERLRPDGFPIVGGITVAHVTSTEETARRLARLGAQVESMEGFAVLRAAELASVPAIELRGISNRVGARERSAWDFDAGVAAVRSLLDALVASFDPRRALRR